MSKEQRLERAMAQFRESPAEEAAKQVVLKRYKLELEGKLMEAMQLLSPDFTEHMTPNRMPPKGKTGYQVQMERAQRVAANPGGASMGGDKSKSFAYQARASEDLVTLFHAYGCDIFRVKNGLVSDHWDCTPWEPFSNKGERAQLADMAESNRMGGPPTAAAPATK
jgi:predicted SnoaL-like aldol condensation-catalyzing enzyme